MSSLVIVFVAIAAVGWASRFESSPSQALDLHKILELVQQHRINKVPSKPPSLQLRIMSSDSDSDDSSTESDETDDSDDSDENRFVSLKKDILQTAAKKKSNNNGLLSTKAKKSYRQMTDKVDDLENQQRAKERIIDLIETAAKGKTNINRLTNSKAKTNYGQIIVKSDDSDNKRLERERIIDLLDTAANDKTKVNRLANSKVQTNYGQIRVKSDDSDNKRLEREKIIDLLESVTNPKYNGNVRTSNRKGKLNIRNNEESYLVKLFSQLYEDEVRKKKLIPNRLTPTVTMDDVKKYYEKQNNNQVEINKDNEVTGLEDYSKIYIVLNPQAVQNSKNKNSLTDMISKVLSQSSSTLTRTPEVEKKPRRYKGFLVDDNLPLRRSKTYRDELDNDDDKKIDLVPLPITAVPT